MSDYIFSNTEIPRKKLYESLKGIYNDETPKISYFYGGWGTLALSENKYNGYLPYENNDYLIIVLGGPILTFTKNDFIENSGNKGTKEIFERWKKGNIVWEEDLSGPFNIVIINKNTNNIECITDLLSFIPTYRSLVENNIYLSTHTNALAKVTLEEKNIDKVSILDFILNGVVTYPYTNYTNIKQLSPAAIHHIKKNESVINISTKPYWIPLEESKYSSIESAAKDLRNSLEEYVSSVIASVNPLAQFISGGEDSRVIAGLLPTNKKVDAFIFLDEMNREGKIAKKIARIYDLNFKFFKRDQNHYLNILPECANLVGSGSQYTHVHTFGFHKSCNLENYPVVLGGLFSDALLKGSRIKKHYLSPKFPFLPQRKDQKHREAKELKHDSFNESLLKKLSIRRKKHLEFVNTFRNDSSEEWFHLYPSSMNKNIPNIHGNRRLFKSYEPFMSKDIVKMSAVLPQEWKLNKKIFRIAAKPYLKKSKWIFHGDGRLPYFPWYINSVFQFKALVKMQLNKKLKLSKKNEGPWGEWSIVMKSEDWKKTVDEYTKESKLDTDIINSGDFNDLFFSDNLKEEQKINLMQILYETK